MRFLPPLRAELAPGTFTHPAYASVGAHIDLLDGADWPSIPTLNARLGAVRHARSNVPVRFVDAGAARADGQHYEQRIFTHGAIATRRENWHDLFNALMWIEQRALKSAVNAAYVLERRHAGVRTRSRAQCALTHFDECGAVVVLSDPDLLAAWDAHAWQELFWHRRAQWHHDVRVLVFGHALLELALVRGSLPTAKCLAVYAATAQSDRAVIASIAERIVTRHALCDPQELRSLPLVGCAGWHADNGSASFYREAPCFRPLRPGRRYPQPLAVCSESSTN